MYTEHFRLRELPFAITPDTSYFMSRAGYQDALNVLLVALRSGEGFVKVTGEVGTGKTMLCRTLLRRLDEQFVTAYVPNPYLKPETLLRTIGDELGVPADEDAEHDFLRALTRTLVGLHDKGKRVVVCMDEVQAMPIESLEVLRLLTNLETEKSKLIQVVLFGQPELDEQLAAPSVRQLRQRITFAYHLEPLNRVAMEQYLQHRLNVAGYSCSTLFSKPALDRIYKASRGIPRLINILAHKSMMAAYGAGELRVDAEHARRAVVDTDDARGWETPRSRWKLIWSVLRRGLGTVSLLALGIIAGAEISAGSLSGWFS